MKYEIKEVEVDGLVPAPWNPRKDITPESVADLAANIKAGGGLLENIGVWPNKETGELYIIYGNRRVVACKVLGLKTVPAMVYDCSEVEAREKTRSENELRLGIDPLEDCRLLSSMREKGRTEQEIAAHYGLPIAMVCRRLKLSDLAPSIRAKVAEGFDITTDALERLSAYPIEIQDHAAELIQDGTADVTRTWAYFEHEVESMTRDLDEGTKFDDCAACPMRTGATPDLFGEVTGNLGRCLNPECYKRHADDLIRKQVDELIDPNVKERVKLKGTYAFYQAGAQSDKPSAKNPCAYWAVDYDGSVKVKYGPSKADKRKAAAVEKEKDEKRKAKIEKDRKIKTDICDKIRQWCRKNLAAEVKKFAGSDPMRIVDLTIRFNICAEGYGNDFDREWDKWTRRRSFENWYKLIGSGTLSQYWNYILTPKKARRIVMFFKSVKWSDVLTKDELAIVRSKEFLNT